MRYAIFGDLGGHFGPLKRGLKSIGVDMKTLDIPEGLTIVQSGDLVHKGPNSTLIVETIDRLMQNNPGRWIQLAGNHELPYLMNFRFFTRDRVDEKTSETLKKWDADGLIHPSFALTSSSGEDYLITHAGLTRPNYLQFGGGSAYDINEYLRDRTWKSISNYGCMLNGGPPDNVAGIFWAESVSEVYASWYNAPEQSGFHQVHGHTSLRTWKNGLLRFMYADWVRDTLDNDFENFRTVWTTDETRFYAIDPGFESQAFSKIIHPLVID